MRMITAFQADNASLTNSKIIESLTIAMKKDETSQYGSQNTSRGN